MLARDPGKSQRVVVVHDAEARLRAGLADRGAERAEDVVAAQPLGDLVHAVEIDDHRAELPVTPPVLERPAGHGDDARVALRGEQAPQALAAHESRGAGKHGREPAHRDISAARSAGR